MIDVISKIEGRTIFIIDALGAILGASKPAQDLLGSFKHRTSTVQIIFPGILDEMLRLLKNKSSLDITHTINNDEFSIINLCNKTYLLEHKDIRDSITRDEELFQLKNMVRKVEELASLGDMVAQISHELNTPLGICITSASHLADKLQHLETNFKEGSLTQSDMRDSLSIAQKAISLTNSNLVRTSKIINGLRSLSKDTRRHDKEKLVLHRYVDNIMGQLQPLLEKQHVVTVISIPTDVVVYESPSSLSQVFSNLVVNSLRHGFSQRSDISRPKITISAHTKSEFIEVTYCDNGVGVPDHIRSSIFEPFVSGGSDEASTGLGMSIVREIVQDNFKGQVNLPPYSTGFKFQFTMRQYK